MKLIENREIFENSKIMKFQVYKKTVNKLSAGNRISNDKFVRVYSTSKFKIQKNEKIFTIGSCFAREIEEKLHNKGFNIINYEFSLDNKYRIGGRWDNNEKYKALGLTMENPRSILNKYSIRSMIDALNIAFDIENLKIKDYLILNDGKYYNPYQHLPLGLTDIDESIALFKSCLSQFNKILSSDVVIITLGQTELWRDKITGKFINGAPPTLGLTKDNSRFEFLIPNYNEVRDDLKDLIDLIRSRNNKIKIILTVSPVPLSRTFIPEDSIMANQRSKSMLLICAREAADYFSFVDYFPSYEMVTISERKWAYEPDMVHVMPHCVDEVIEQFTNLFI